MDASFKIPLGLCKQSIMKLDSFMSDLNEMREDTDVSQEHKDVFSGMAEVASVMEATLLNLVREECGEEEFLNESVMMDPLERYPEFGNTLDEIVE